MESLEFCDIWVSWSWEKFVQILFPLSLMPLTSIPACTGVIDRADMKCLWNNEYENCHDKSRIRCLLNWELNNFSAETFTKCWIWLKSLLVHFKFLSLYGGMEYFNMHSEEVRLSDKWGNVLTAFIFSFFLDFDTAAHQSGYWSLLTQNQTQIPLQVSAPWYWQMEK